MKIKINYKCLVCVFALTLIVLAITHSGHASTLGCESVDGMAIFGYDYNGWKFIGAIANEFDSDSIANEFGAGNEFKSDSIFNEFGRFGNEFGSYSAFNEFASNPPIIINDGYKFVGYLTVSDFKTPNINTYEAMSCAKKSFRSFSNSDLEDTIFKSIPSGGYNRPPEYSQQDMESLLKNSCPNNATYLNGQCFCNDGYTANGSGCVTYNQNCQNKYGINSYGDKQYCYCLTGYEFSADKTTCVKSLVCPTNASKINNVCTCNSGYVMRGNNCITHTQDCIQSFGNNVVGVKGNDNNSSCDCVSGYIWNSQRTGCKVIENTPDVVANAPIDIPTDSLTEDIKCADGLVLSPRKNVCIKVPENAHIVNSPTDLWLCNDGYKETGNKCVLTDSTNLQQNQNQEEVETNNISQEPSKNIFKKIGNFFKSLFKRKNK